MAPGRSVPAQSVCVLGQAVWGGNLTCKPEPETRKLQKPSHMHWQSPGGRQVQRRIIRA